MSGPNCFSLSAAGVPSLASRRQWLRGLCRLGMAASVMPRVGPACAAEAADGSEWPAHQWLMGRSLSRVAQRDRRLAWWFRVYQAGLYLPEGLSAQHTAGQAAGPDAPLPDAPRRLWVRLHTEVAPSRLQASLRAALHTALQSLGERSADAPALRTLAQEAQQQMPVLKAGDVLTIDWVPADGLVVRLNERLWLRAAVSSLVFGVLIQPWLDEGGGTRSPAVWLVSR